MDDVIADETTGKHAPWDRFAWAFGVVPVVFMLFPITSAINAPAPEAARIVAVALLVVYSVVYIAVYVWVVRAARWRTAGSRGLRGLAVMIALASVAAVLVGPGALGVGSFLLSIAMFSGPVKRAFLLATALLLAQYIVLAIWLMTMRDGFAEFGVLFVPPVFVFVLLACIRLITDAQEEHDVLEHQHVLVAERERVARDVHDVLGHSLTVVTVKAELAERLVDIDPERAKAEIAQVRSLARESLAEVRATVSGLRVARLGDELESSTVALEGAGIDAEVPVDVDIVDPRHRIVVAWVLREAITNVVRHSSASRCIVTFEAHRLLVEDDGIGTPVAVAERGLRGIRERVDAAGARLMVGPARIPDPERETARMASTPSTNAPARPGTRVEVRW